MSFVSNILLTWYYIKHWNQIAIFFYAFNKRWRTRTPWMHHSVYSSRILVVWQFTFTGILYSTLQRYKKFGNVTVKNFLNESLLSLLWFIIYGQGSFEKGSMWTVKNLFNCVCVVTPIVSLVCTHAIEKEGFLPLIVNMLFVSINFSLEKDFAEIFTAFVNFNIMLCNLCNFRA